MRRCRVPVRQLVCLPASCCITARGLGPVCRRIHSLGSTRSLGAPPDRTRHRGMAPQSKRLKMTPAGDRDSALPITSMDSSSNLQAGTESAATFPTEASPRPSPMTRKNDTITLLPAESLLRALLLDCREHMLKHKLAHVAGLDIWFTGGWVRDRLLDIECYDIDIALSSMTGQAFGEILASFFQENEPRYKQRAQDLGVADATMSGLHTTKLNIRKSKQLETTIGKVFGLDVDIVNLRKEVYDQDSRTPQMEFGTAEEDVFRRDATVNSLFFNLDSQQVVDLTGKGLQDMTDGIIRTPLEPRQTFMDDPLRVLRLIRIGSKLGYTLHPDTSACMKNREIHEALTAKVSRERVGIEIFKIMKQPDPRLAFHTIFNAGLYASVFLQLDNSLVRALESSLPAQDPQQQWPVTWPRAYNLLANLRIAGSSRLGQLVRSDCVSEGLWVMAAYAPIAGLRSAMLRQAVATATEALKTTVKTSKLLEAALKNFDSIGDLIARTNNELEIQRSVVGMAIRAWGASWKLQLLYSLLAKVVYMPILSQLTSPTAYDHEAVAELSHQYNVFLDFVAKNNLENAFDLRPILDGNAIMRLFGVTKGGSFLKTAMDELIAWQLDNESLGIDEAQKWLEHQQDRLGVPRCSAP